MERPGRNGRRVSPAKADALRALLEVVVELSFVDILTLGGEVVMGKAPTFRFGAIVDEAALAHAIDPRNPDPKAPTSAPSAENLTERKIDDDVL